jgi:hypothetical protein
VAADYREKFYFFNQNVTQESSEIVAVGNNFTRHYTLVDKTKQEIERIL